MNVELYDLSRLSIVMLFVFYIFINSNTIYLEIRSKKYWLRYFEVFWYTSLIAFKTVWS